MTTRPSVYIFTGQQIDIVPSTAAGWVGTIDTATGDHLLYIPAGATTIANCRIHLDRASTASKGARLDAVSWNYRVISGTLTSATRTLTRQVFLPTASADPATPVVEAVTVAVAPDLTASANNYQVRETLNAAAFDNDALTAGVSYLYRLTLVASTACVVAIRSADAECLTDWA